jgi:hypothetical protein
VFTHTFGSKEVVEVIMRRIEREREREIIQEETRSSALHVEITRSSISLLAWILSSILKVFHVSSIHVARFSSIELVLYSWKEEQEERE